MSTAQEYIKPDNNNAPPMLLLRVMSWMSVAVLLYGVYVLYKILDWDFRVDVYECTYTHTTCNSGYSIWQWVAPILLGAVALAAVGHMKSHFYRQVEQGKVVGKDFRVDFGKSQHLLNLYGYNRAGEMTYYWQNVTSGAYVKYNEGDFVDFR